MSSQMTLLDSPAVTSLLGLAAGSMPCNLQADQRIPPSGPEAAPVSRSRVRGKVRERKTPGTCGPSSDALSPTASLQRSLESRLHQRLDVNGSPEYVLTWKDWDMQLGPPICALRARARRTSDNGFTGWPTPNIPNRGCEMDKSGRPKSGGIDLQSTVQLVGWPTPRAEDSESTGAHRGVPDTLTSAARLSGWGTLGASDWKGASTTRAKDSRGQLKHQLPIPGLDATPSDAKTTRPVAYRLNPHFSRWLMGFPVEWFNSVDWVTLSSRKSRPHS